MLGSGSPDGRHPGWPCSLGPLAVRAGVVTLRPVRLRDARDWSRLRRRDEDYLAGWEPDAPGRWQERNSPWAWLAQCSGLRSLARQSQILPLAILVDGEYSGQLTLGNVVHGSVRSCWVGYWVQARLAGQGAATAAVALAVDHAFGPVGLHRVEATVHPHNSASLRVLAKLGFRDEGLLRRYLLVRGAWRDHRLLAITREEVGMGVTTGLVAAGRAQRA